VAQQKKFTTQHINCQCTVEIEDITIYFLFILGIRCLMTIKQLIISSSSTFKKISLSIKVIKQSSKRSSFILFFNLFLSHRLAKPTVQCLYHDPLHHLRESKMTMNFSLLQFFEIVMQYLHLSSSYFNLKNTIKLHRNLCKISCTHNKSEWPSKRHCELRFAKHTNEQQMKI
jgi:hypothetical protein